MGFTLNQLEQERQIRKLQKKEDKDTKDYEQLSNLPKVNNVELKGDQTTSDLGINADNVMMSNGMASVEDAITQLKSGLLRLKSIALSGTLNADGNIGITGLTQKDYPISFIAGDDSADVVVFFDGSTVSGYQKYANFLTKRSVAVTGTVVYISGETTN